jgi:hypothetical protein
VNGACDLGFDHAAHFENAGRYAAQLGVELGGQVFVAHLNLLGSEVGRNAGVVPSQRGQPKRPVM